MKTTLDLDAAARTLPTGAPVVMLNLLRYRKDGGREIYFRDYVGAFNILAAGKGVKVMFVGNVQAQLVAPAGETWDDVALVEYPSFEIFREIVESEGYRTTAAPHREAALEDWRLVALTMPR